MTTEPAPAAPTPTLDATTSSSSAAAPPASPPRSRWPARCARSSSSTRAGPRNATAPPACTTTSAARTSPPPTSWPTAGRALASYGGRVETGEVDPPRAPRPGTVCGRGSARRWPTAARSRPAAWSSPPGWSTSCRRSPGSRERWGRDVLHCPYCHGYEARGTAIGILSTTPMTAHQALMFRQLSDDVTVLTHTGPALGDEDRERLEARGVRFVDGEVVEVLTTDDALSGVRLASGDGRRRCRTSPSPPPPSRTRPCWPTSGVEVADFAMGDFVLGAYAVAEPTGVTSVPGLYTAGNVSTIQAQVSTSAAGGLMTGALVNAHLIEEEATHAVAERRATEALLGRALPRGRMHPREAEPGPRRGRRRPAGRAPRSTWAAATATTRSGWPGRAGGCSGIDVSGTAVERARERGASGRASPGGPRSSGTTSRRPSRRATFDLVTTHYLHATRRAAPRRGAPPRRRGRRARAGRCSSSATPRCRRGRGRTSPTADGARARARHGHGRRAAVARGGLGRARRSTTTGRPSASRSRRARSAGPTASTARWTTASSSPAVAGRAPVGSDQRGEPGEQPVDLVGRRCRRRARPGRPRRRRAPSARNGSTA